MHIPAKFLFEGEMRTVKEIQAIVPCMCDGTIRRHLRAGRNTRQALLAFDVGAAKSRNGRKGGSPAMRQYPEWSRPGAAHVEDVEAKAA